ncbi:MAG TPA: J domain-containing protein [Pyrinomonadaceae bacterium]
MSEPDRSKNYYEILGAEEDASRGEIDRLYRRKAVEHHPDRGGCEEEMKNLNEAYRVLKDEGMRRTYDDERQRARFVRTEFAERDVTPRAQPPAQLDAITHQVLASIIFIMLGLVLLFVVRFQYVLFLWPLALLAVFMVLVGVVQAHGVMSAVRSRLRATHPARRFVVVQEAVFWSVVCGGVYGVYLLLTAV